MEDTSGVAPGMIYHAYRAVQMVFGGILAQIDRPVLLFENSAPIVYYRAGRDHSVQMRNQKKRSAAPDRQVGQASISCDYEFRSPHPGNGSIQRTVSRPRAGHIAFQGQIAGLPSPGCSHFEICPAQEHFDESRPVKPVLRHTVTSQPGAHNDVPVKVRFR